MRKPLAAAALSLAIALSACVATPAIDRVGALEIQIQALSAARERAVAVGDQAGADAAAGAMAAREREREGLLPEVAAEREAKRKWGGEVVAMIFALGTAALGVAGAVGRRAATGGIAG